MHLSIPAYYRICERMIAVVLFLAVVCDAKSYGISKNGNIDQGAITSGYMESEWDQVVACLEGYLRRKGDNQVSEEERIFAYKFLGVIFAADSLTRAKAESYFTRMLRMSPDIDIVDLYPSLRVIEIFKATKSDYEKFVRYSSQHDNIGRKTATSDPPKSSNSTPISTRTAPINRKKTHPEIGASQSNAWLWWSLAFATAAGVGAGAYYLTTQDKPVKTEFSDVTQQ